MLIKKKIEYFVVIIGGFCKKVSGEGRGRETRSGGEEIPRLCVEATF